MIVGNFSQSDGTAAVAAVGSNAPVTGLILNLFIGIALGANVVIANAIGRGSREAVRNAVHTSIVTALIGGVIVAIIGELLAGPLLGMLNVTADVFPLALAYLRIYLIGMPVILLYNFETAIFRSIGDTQAPLAALADFRRAQRDHGTDFRRIVPYGVSSGVATATVIANVVSSMILLYRLVHTDAAIHVDLREFGIDWFTLRQILRIGLPAGVQSAVFAVANIIIQAAINSLGTVVMAASSAAFNIEIIAYYVLNSFSQACATFTGQNYGAKRIGRCKRVLGICILEDFIATAATIAVVLFFGHSLLALFDCDTAGHFRRLHQTRHGVLRLHVQHAVRGHVRISARLRHLTGAGAAHRNRRGRRAHHLDRVRVPRASHVRGHHDRLPDQPRRNRRTHRHRSALLPSVQAIRR